MDVLKVLLYMVVAALLAALGVSWKDYKKARAEEPKEKVTEMNLQIREILEGRARMKADRDRITGRAVPPAMEETPEVGPAPTLSPEEIAALDAASTLSDPPPDEDGGEVLSAEQRAEAITKAPVVAKILEWVEDPQLGVICVLEVTDAAIVKTGAILAIRRNGGILGQVKVGEINPEGTLATPTTKFGEMKPVKGDELIVKPPGS
ncbi:hypothetical protein [Luteolibacter sp. Populi]|uniref:hypothetical protein n=1 Tax=Luteolibacter sp. Populi TaxID=3230487 RepID=UPI003467D63C